MTRKQLEEKRDKLKKERMKHSLALAKLDQQIQEAKDEYKLLTGKDYEPNK